MGRSAQRQASTRRSCIALGATWRQSKDGGCKQSRQDAAVSVLACESSTGIPEELLPPFGGKNCTPLVRSPVWQFCAMMPYAVTCTQTATSGCAKCCPERRVERLDGVLVQWCKPAADQRTHASQHSMKCQQASSVRSKHTGKQMSCQACRYRQGYRQRTSAPLLSCTRTSRGGAGALGVSHRAPARLFRFTQLLWGPLICTDATEPS